MEYLTYTAENSVILQESKDTSHPDHVSFDLPDMAEKVTFRNTGEQQCVIVAIDYYIDNSTGISIPQGIPMRVEYYTIAGEQVSTPPAGLYIMRTTMTDGRVITQKAWK